MTWVCESCQADARKKGRHRRHMTCQKKANIGFKTRECECPCNA